MDEHLDSLFEKGFFSFGREGAVFDIFKYLSEAMIEEVKGNTIITARKGKSKMMMIVHDGKLAVSGNVKAFGDELSVLEKDCIREYAVSVRAKKDLIFSLSAGRFCRFVLVPVLLEVYNKFGLKMFEYCNILNSTSAEKGFFIFKIKEKVKAFYKKDALNVTFNNASFSVKLSHLKENESLAMKNFDLSPYQNNTRDAFFAGLPYTLEALAGRDFEYSFNGEAGALEEIFKAMLSALYDYLMIEEV